MPCPKLVSWTWPCWALPRFDRLGSAAPRPSRRASRCRHSHEQRATKLGSSLFGLVCFGGKDRPHSAFSRAPGSHQRGSVAPLILWFVLYNRDAARFNGTEPTRNRLSLSGTIAISGLPCSHRHRRLRLLATPTVGFHW